MFFPLSSSLGSLSSRIWWNRCGRWGLGTAHLPTVWQDTLGSVYLLGAGLLLIRNIVGVLRFCLLLSKQEVIPQDVIRLIDSTRFTVPFSVFNYVFINSRHLPDMERKVIFAHERAHVAQQHWIDLALIEIVRIILWFNPFVWGYDAHTLNKTTNTWPIVRYYKKETPLAFIVQPCLTIASRCLFSCCPTPLLVLPYPAVSI